MRLDVARRQAVRRGIEGAGHRQAAYLRILELAIDEPQRQQVAAQVDALVEAPLEAFAVHAAGLGDRVQESAIETVQNRARRLAVRLAHVGPPEHVGRALVDADRLDLGLDAQLLEHLLDEWRLHAEAVHLDAGVGQQVETVRRERDVVAELVGDRGERVDELPARAKVGERFPQILRLGPAVARGAHAEMDARDPVVVRRPLESQAQDVHLMLCAFQLGREEVRRRLLDDQALEVDDEDRRGVDLHPWGIAEEGRQQHHAREYQDRDDCDDGDENEGDALHGRARVALP